MKTGVFISLLFVSALINSSGAYAGKNPAAAVQLLESFSRSCSSYGAWTSVALGQSRALVETLRAVKAQQDSDCAGVDSSLEKAIDFSNEISRIQMDEASQKYREAQDQVSNIALFLRNLEQSGKGNDPLAAALRTQLLEARKNIVTAKAAVESSDSVAARKRLSTGTAALVRYGSGLANASNLSACYASAPYMAVEVAASLLAVGGAFAAPTVGPALTATGALMTAGVNYYRNHKMDRAVLKNQQTLMRSALSCGLESMSNLYCSAKSTERLARLAQLSEHDKAWKPVGAWEGLDIIGRKLPILNSWLLEAGGGVEASDQYAAERKNSVRRRKNEIQMIRTDVQGLFNYQARLIADASDEQKKADILRKTLKDAFSSVYGTSNGMTVTTTSITNYYGVAKIILRLSGDTSKTCEDLAGSSHTYQQALEVCAIAGGFAGLKSRTETLIDDVDQLVTKEFLGEVTTESRHLLVKATQGKLDEPAPVEILRDISLYLRKAIDYAKLHPKPSDRKRIKEAEELAKRLEAAADLIDSADIDLEDDDPKCKEIGEQKPHPSCPQAVIRAIFNRFKLFEGTQIISSQIVDQVQWDVEAKIKDKNYPNQISQDLIAAGKDLAEQLKAANIEPKNAPQILANDLNGAAAASQRNIREFVSFFAGDLNSALRDIRESADRAGEPLYPTVSPLTGEPVSRSNRNVLARLCLLVLTTGESGWPAGVDITHCRNAVYESEYRHAKTKQSLLVLGFENVLREMSAGKLNALEDRMCIVSNFSRTARLFGAGFSDRPVGGILAPKASLSAPVRWEEMRNMWSGEVSR